MSGYRFERLRPDDLAMVARWRAEPHVQQWWGEPEIEPEVDKLDHPHIAAFVVSWADKPFAFLQDYDVHAWDSHPFAHLPPGSRGIDLLIGELDMVAKGHGTALVRQFLADRWAHGCPAVGTDPHPDNLRAQRAFAKAGFARVSGPIDTLWGRALLMECWAP